MRGHIDLSRNAVANRYVIKHSLMLTRCSRLHYNQLHMH